MRLLQTKNQVATFIALLFHVSGFIAIGIFKSQLFIDLTPLNLLVSFGLILYTQPKPNSAFFAFLAIAFAIGFGAEWIGINTGRLFGNYQYGTVLGPEWQGVPWLIGVNWFIMMYTIGISFHMFHKMLEGKAGELSSFNKKYMAFSLVFDGAALAVLVDWVIEPVAIKMGLWSWSGNVIPSLNYWSWFGVSVIIMIIFRLLPFEKHNLFAVHLLLIQLMFFLLLSKVF